MVASVAVDKSAYKLSGANVTQAPVVAKATRIGSTNQYQMLWQRTDNHTSYVPPSIENLGLDTAGQTRAFENSVSGDSVT